MTVDEYLRGQGLEAVGDGMWRVNGIPGHDGEIWDTNDVAHHCAYEVFQEELPPDEAMRLALDLLDLLDEYWAADMIRWAIRNGLPESAVELMWAYFRQRLEDERDAYSITYVLWVEWFEDRKTSEEAFRRVLGDDVERWHAEGRLTCALADPRTARRVRRVVESSGPVPWATKRDALWRLVAVPAMHDALLNAVLFGYHDVYGDLDPADAVALLDSLDLPPDTRHLAPLRAVLRAGVANNRYNIALWAQLGGERD